MSINQAPLTHDTFPHHSNCYVVHCDGGLSYVRPMSEAEKASSNAFYTSIRNIQSSYNHIVQIDVHHDGRLYRSYSGLRLQDLFSKSLNNSKH